MDCMRRLEIIFLTVTFITGNATIYVLYKDGCINKTNEGVTNVTIKTTLPNNYPGTCYAYCKNQTKLSNESYLALQNEVCLCGEHYNVLTVQIIPRCSDTCPGHNVHHCGQVSGATFSVYKVALVPNVTDETSCMTASCQSGKRILNSVNCSGAQRTHCVGRSPGSSPDCNKTEVTWNSSLCQYYDQLHFFTQRNELCTSNRACTVPAWAGMFAPRAPPKLCSPANITHGHWNYTYLGSEAVEYHCDSGYGLNGNSTAYCMDGGKWNINPPSCVPVLSSSTVSYHTSPSSSVTLSAVTSIELSTMPLSSLSIMPTTTVATTPSTSVVQHTATTLKITPSPIVSASQRSTAGTEQSVLSSGAIAGIGVGAFVGGGLTLAALIFWRFKVKRGSQVMVTSQTSSSKNEPGQAENNKTGETIPPNITTENGT